jgi:DNA-binding response OmpR family regulator
MHVLIAEDDRVTGEILARTLQRWSYSTTVVSDGAQAWDRLKVATDPTLAILDWMMPEMDGPDVCRRVRQELPLANMYLLLVTARESRGDVVAGLDAGADDYIIKPFDPEELRARVAVGTRVLGLQQRLAERVEELQTALSNVKQLRGLLPICSYCKRIRGDDQYWQQVEGYVAEHSDRLAASRRPAPAKKLRDRDSCRGQGVPAICLTICRASGRLTPHVGSSTRQRATVRSQPHVHGWAFSCCSASVRLAIGSEARSTPGMVVACAPLTIFSPCV